jgi:hypothetical protein
MPSDKDIIEWAERKQDQFGIFTPVQYRFAERNIKQLREEYQNEHR